MVAGFRRSFSFSGSPRPKPAPQKSHHVRSASLPCRSHPLISQLEDNIRSVNSWQGQPQPQPQPQSASVWLCGGLACLELLHSSINDLLSLPQSHGALHRGSASEWTGRALDDILRLADTQGSFRSEIVALREHQSDAQVAIRRKDAVKLASCLKSMRRTEKELAKLASSVRETSKTTTPIRFTNGMEEAELAGIIREAMSATASVLATVFLGVAAVSSATSAAKVCRRMPLRRLPPSRSSKLGREEGRESGMMMERLEKAEECVRAVEIRSERLFRNLANTGVSLLNIMSC